MTFKEKIDKLLSISEKKFNSIYDLEVKSGIGMGTIRKAYDENRQPSNRIIWKFLECLNINPEWWETGKGDIYLSNNTHVDKTGDNTKFDSIREMLEGGEYFIISAALKDNYQLVNIKTQEILEKELAAKNEQLRNREEQIARLNDTLRELYLANLATKGTKVKEAK